MRSLLTGRRALGEIQNTYSAGFALIALCVLVPIGCTNVTAPKTQLAQLLKTNTPCRVRLQPAWTGHVERTVRTEHFTSTHSPQREQLERELQFDWFEYSEKPSPFNFGARTVSRSEGGNLESSFHAFRSSLPTDGELNVAKTVSALEKFLGPSQGPRCAWGLDNEIHSTAGWAFWTLKDSTTIETVSISCRITRHENANDPEWHVDDMRVTRGTAKPKER